MHCRYPLGRPVGTTIYPGMQIASVGIWRALNMLGVEWSLNDVCVFVPVWFGVAATMALGLLAAETSGSANSGVFAARGARTRPPPAAWRGSSVPGGAATLCLDAFPVSCQCASDSCVM